MRFAIQKRANRKGSSVPLKKYDMYWLRVRPSCEVSKKSGTYQDHIRDEATLQDSDKSPGDEKRSPSLEPELRAGNNAPQDHLSGNPPIAWGTRSVTALAGGRLGFPLTGQSSC